MATDTIATRSGALARGLRSFLRPILLTMLAWLLIAYGGVEATLLHLISAVVFAVAALAILSGRPSARTAALARLAVALALGVGLWGVLQVLPLDEGAAVAGAWAELWAATKAAQRTISIAPGDTLSAIPVVLLPIAAFVACLLLFNSEHAGMNVLRAAGFLGSLLALFGIAQFTLFPDTLLLAPKLFYADSLTGVFVNRNTAATYFGTIVILNAALAVQALRFGQGRAKPILWVVGAAVALIALMLTQSRAGIGSTLLALVVGATLVAKDTSGAVSGETGAKTPGSVLWKIASRLLVAVVVITIVAVLLTERAVLRDAAQSGLDGRFCVLPGILRMLGDNWLLGTGMGTFRLAFPAYRDPACGMEGIWDMAHNVYLEGATSLGLPFALFAITGVVGLGRAFVIGLRERRRYRPIAIAGLSILLLAGTHSLFDFSIQIPGYATTFACLMAAIAAVSLARPKGRCR